MMSQNIERFLFNTINENQSNVFVVIGKEVDFVYLAKKFKENFCAETRSTMVYYAPKKK